MSTTPSFEVIADPETGEVIAANEADREYLIDMYAQLLVRAEIAAKQAASARRNLALLMNVGEAVPTVEGYAVTVKPGAPGRRQVVPHALDEHEEVLAEIPALAIREETKVVRTYPKVSDLTTTEARAELARRGLTPETFLAAGLPGEPRVEVIPPKEAL